MTKRTPSISVIIPAYNAAAFIAETLDSVLVQACEEFEVIVVNDGSTDDTQQVLAPFEGRIRVIDQENAGVARARNVGIENAHGDWIAFIDADDLWTPDKLAVQMGTIGRHRWSHTNSFYFGFGQDGTTSRSDLTAQYGGAVFDQLIVNNFITTSTVIMDRHLLTSCGGFDESLALMEDWKLWTEAAKMEALHYEPSCLAYYRVFPGSASRKARQVLPHHIKFINWLFDGIPSSNPSSRLRPKALAESYAMCSYVAEDSRDFLFSAYCSLKAAQHDMGCAARWKRFLRAASNIVLRPPMS